MEKFLIIFYNRLISEHFERAKEHKKCNQFMFSDWFLHYLLFATNQIVADCSTSQFEFSSYSPLQAETSFN